MNGILQVLSRFTFILLLLCAVSLGVHQPEKSCVTGFVSVKEVSTQQQRNRQTRPTEVRAREISKPIPVFQAIKTFEQLRTCNVQEVEHVTLRDVFLTAYSLDVRSTGKTPAAPDYGITFSGTRATAGRTVAVDPRVIPIGTPVYIDLKGVGWRIAEDTGGAVKGRHIDVLLNSEEAAIQFGVKRHVRVYIPITDPVSVMATSPSKP